METVLHLSRDTSKLIKSDDRMLRDSALLFMAASRSNKAERVERAITRIYDEAFSLNELRDSDAYRPLAIVAGYRAKNVADMFLYDLRMKNQIARTLVEIAHTDRFWSPLEGITYEDLTAVWGIGPKVANWILSALTDDSTRAVLDTHVLNLIRQFNFPGVPDQTPQDHITYARVERYWNMILDKYFHGARKDADLLVWSAVREHGASAVARMLRSGTFPVAL